ncbi:regulatory protein ToxS [Vibrio japonicus]|uniref:Regulatory protein ToxS n=1 Tax=Vibrio japonicus TaxID=1824638 RepID=A0ABY5LGS2_9VIBR|nr:regulatory protein ToxS [Vibrio japonicus]UUM31244.1 regulatory protein ToxS [Vibrio japonicus]
MKQKFAAGLLTLSALFSAWLYWGSDFKTEQTLTSKEWQSKMIALIAESEGVVGPLRKVDVTSNVKYLNNGTYIRVSTVRLYADKMAAKRVADTNTDNVIHISETGVWEISDNYLLISPTEFKDISSAQSKDFTEDELKVVTQIFKMDAQQSRRIDIVNEKTLLLTSLNHGSTVLSSN